MLHHISQREKIIVMLAVMSGLFLVALDQTIIATALGKIVEEFKSFSSLSWVVTAYLLTTTVTVPIAGKLSDQFGRRIVLMTGVAIFTLGSLLSGAAQDIQQLIWARAFQGLGGGIITANAFTIIGDLFMPRERARWQGMIAAVFGLSSLVGPLLGGFLTDPHPILGLTTSWRWTFWINVPIGIISFIVISMYAPSVRRSEKPRVDYLGAALLTLALGSLILAVDNTDKIFASLIDTGWNLNAIKASLYGLFGVATAGFVIAESRASEPIIPLRFFKNRNFTTVMVAALLFGAAFLGAILYLTQFNQQVFGANATTSGLMILPMVAGLATCAALTGQFVTRTGRYRWPIIIGFSVATVAVGFLSTLTPTSPYWHEAVLMLLAGAGLGAGMPIMNLAVQNEFEQHDLGAATSASQLFRGLGSTIGTAVFGSILAAGITTQLGNLSDNVYIQTLQRQPAAAALLGDLNSDTALNLNNADTKAAIIDGATQGVANLPAPVAQKTLDQLKTQQSDFSNDVVDAFSQSLRPVFMIAAVLMLLATIAVSRIRETTLRTGHGTPAETSDQPESPARPQPARRVVRL